MPKEFLQSDAASAEASPMERPLVRIKEKIWTVGDLLSSLRQAGIVQGDDILVHSAIPPLGLPMTPFPQGQGGSKTLEAFINGPDFLGAFVDALKEAVGGRGTLLMPAFTYSFCKNEVFHIEDTPSTVGILTEYFRKQDGVTRTPDPIFSCAVSGARREEYAQISNVCFGVDSVFDRLYHNNGKVVFLGAEMQSMTFVHYIERKFGVPYRYDKEFRGRIVSRAAGFETSCIYYVRDTERNSVFRSEIIAEYARATDNLHSSRFGAGCISALNARKLCDDLMGELARNPLFLLGE